MEDFILVLFLIAFIIAIFCLMTLLEIIGFKKLAKKLEESNSKLIFNLMIIVSGLLCIAYSLGKIYGVIR